MSVGLGTTTVMGVKEESSFRSRIEVTDRVPLLSEGIDFENVDVLHDYLHGDAAIPASQRAFEPVKGSVEMNMCYTEKDTSFVSATVPLALGMGTVEGKTAQGSYMITFQDALAKFGTYAWNKGHHASKVWQAISCYVNSFTLACNQQEPLKLTQELIAYDLKVDDTTNNVTVLNALTDDVPGLILFSDFIFRIGDQAGALSASDQVAISAFTLTVNNNLTEAQQATTENSGHTDVFQSLQPVRNGFREVTLEITIPRYSSDTFFDFRTNDTNLQAEFFGTHPSTSYEFDILFPNLKIESVSAPVSGAEALEQTITMRCLKRNSASDIAFGDASTDDGEVWFETDDERADGDLFGVAWT